MGNEQNIRNFTSVDIAAYHQGRLTPAEMHALEKAAMEDPFLGDALEGYQAQATLTTDFAELRSRLQDRIGEEKKTRVIAAGSYRWLRIAALFILIAGAGLLIYQFGGSNTATAPVAQKDNASSKTAIADTTSSTALTPAIDNKLDEIKPEKTTTLPKNDVSISAAQGYSTDRSIAAATARRDSLIVNEETKKAVAFNENTREQDYKAKSAAKETNDKALLDEKLTGRTAGVAVQNQKASPVAMNEDSRQAPGRARNYAGINQTNVFRGRVTDDENNPLPFVNITNPVDNVGTYSDAKGNFVITYPDSILDVQVRSLGYVNRNARLQNNLNDNKIVMNDDRSSLTEIVVSNKQINTKRRESNLVLEEPVPADGWAAYDAYLANNLNIPETFTSKQTGGGEVELSFEVNKLGEPVKIRVEKSLCETCDKEAIRLVKEGPKWKRKARKGRTSVTIAF